MMAVLLPVWLCHHLTHRVLALQLSNHERLLGSSFSSASCNMLVGWLAVCICAHMIKVWHTRSCKHSWTPCSAMLTDWHRHTALYIA